MSVESRAEGRIFRVDLPGWYFRLELGRPTTFLTVAFYVLQPRAK